MTTITKAYVRMWEKDPLHALVERGCTFSVASTFYPYKIKQLVTCKGKLNANIQGIYGRS